MHEAHAARRRGQTRRMFGNRGAAVIAAAIVVCLSASPLAAEAVSIQGSTIVNARIIEPHRGEIEAFSGRRLVVIPNKSIHGLTALLEGRADMAMISSALDGEAAVVLLKRPELPIGRLQSFEIARTRVAFAAHPTNPVKSLTLDQLRQILLGRIESWKDVGGRDQAIVTVSVQPGGGVPTTVRSELLAGRPFAPGRLVEVEASHHVVKVVEQEEGALGITQLGLIQAGRVTELATDAKIEQQLNLVTLGHPTAAQLAVIEAARRVAAARLF